MKSWRYPYSVKTVSTPSVPSLAYVDEGSGSPLIFIHGLGSNLHAWKKNIDELRRSYRCIAIDLPGYGKSSQKDFPFTMSFFSKAILEFIEALGLSDVTLIGHSMGGHISVMTSLKQQEVIKSLILIAPAGFETFTEREKSWFDITLTPGIIKSLTASQIIRNFEINFHHFPEDARFMIDDRMIMREVGEAYDHFCKMIPACIKGMLKEPIFEQLSSIQQDTLILYGTEDQLIPNRLIHPHLSVQAIARAGHQQIPNSYLSLIPDAGHFPQWEQAFLVNIAIINFLKTQ